MSLVIGPKDLKFSLKLNVTQDALAIFFHISLVDLGNLFLVRLVYSIVPRSRRHIQAHSQV